MRLLPSIPALLSFLLLGCIEGEEEIWLERDGSGRLEASYKMPSAVMDQIGKPNEVVDLLKNAAADDPHVHFDLISVTTEGDEVTLKISGSFDHLGNFATFPQRQLREPAKPEERSIIDVLFGETNSQFPPCATILKKAGNPKCGKPSRTLGKVSHGNLHLSQRGVATVWCHPPASLCPASAKTGQSSWHQISPKPKTPVESYPPLAEGCFWQERSGNCSPNRFNGRRSPRQPLHLGQPAAREWRSRSKCQPEESPTL